jgi:RNA polymerase sigma-70 factor (ECF subfamily)
LTEASPANADLLSAAQAGDEDAYASLFSPMRPGLHAYCYRLLGSLHDADDAMQDTLLRAWLGIGKFEGRSSIRSWLYTIATNVCLDTIKRRAKRALPADLRPPSEHAMPDEHPLTEVSWLDPWAAEVTDGRAAPHARYELRESVELAFVAALQHLPGNQRAALVLFEVLGFTVREIADTMATSTASVNSALQRARKIIEERVPARSQQQTLRALGDEKLSELVDDYTGALQRGDVDALLALLTEDATWSMPPVPSWYRGREAVTDFLVRMPLRESWRHLRTSANGQIAVGCYRWDEQAAAHVAFVIDVLTLRGDRISDVTAFIGGDLFPRFNLPAVY